MSNLLIQNLSPCPLFSLSFFVCCSEEGDEDFYFEEVERNGFGRADPASSIGGAFNKQAPFLGSDSPYSLSEDAASTTSSGSIVMTNGENSMDSGPPSPISNNSGHFFRAGGGGGCAGTSMAPNTSPPQVYYAHLEDHEYVNRRPEPTIMRPRKKNYSGSLLAKNSSNGGGGGGGGAGLFGSYPSSSAFSSSSSKPINIPSMSGREFTMSHSFNGSDSFASSGFGSYSSSSAFSSMSPRSAGVGGSLSSSLSSTGHHKHARIGYKASSGGLSILQSSAANNANRTSPTKRVRGETRKCRKVYGMEKKDQWCTQCKWKKACTRFTD